MIWIVLEIILALVLFIVAYVSLKYYKAMRKADFYVGQGVVKQNGFDSFPLGNVTQVMQIVPQLKQRKKEGGKNVIHQQLWLLDQQDASKADGSYDAGKIPLVITNFAGDVSIKIADPVVVQDILVTKNALLDKTSMMEKMFWNFFKNSFLVSKTNDLWKKKRQATSHAFYKDKLVHMLDVLKERVLDTQNKWLTAIAAAESSEDGSIEIDMTKEIPLIF